MGNDINRTKCEALLNKTLERRGLTSIGNEHSSVSCLLYMTVTCDVICWPLNHIVRKLYLNLDYFESTVKEPELSIEFQLQVK